MTYGWVVPRCLFVGFAVLALTALPLPPAPAAPASRPSSPVALPVTLLSLGNTTLQIQGSDGRPVSVRIAPASLFLRRGLLVSACDFTPGETALLRKRAGVGGRAQVVLLSDPDSAAAIENYRGRPLSGRIVSADAAAWVVQPADRPDSAPLTLRLSSGTTYHTGGSAVSASAFGPGAAVTVTTRGLPDGMLLAVSVSEAADTGAAAPTAGETRRAAFLSGTVVDVQPDGRMAVVRDKSSEDRVAAVDSRTHIKVRKQPASLADIRPGMRVSIWLGKDQDASGNPIATTISASDAPLRKP